MTDLIARLEALTGPDREVDAEIRLHVIAKELQSGRDGGEIRREMGHWSLEAHDSNVPRYTGSLDAAMTLVPGPDKHGSQWRIFLERKPTTEGTWFATVRPHGEDGWSGMCVYDYPAIALCIAAVRAIEARHA